MATAGEASDLVLDRMLNLFSKPKSIEDGDVTLREYSAHLEHYDAEVLGKAWDVVKLRKGQWWPTLGEIDEACRRFLPSKYVSHKPQISEFDALNCTAGKDARRAGYGWEYYCFVRDAGRHPSPNEIRRMAAVPVQFDGAIVMLEAMLDDDPKARLWEIDVARMIAWGRAIRAQSERLRAEP